MSIDRFEDIGAYLLGALEPDEHEAFERALEADPRLRHEVDQLRFAADALPASAEQLAPPPDLKRRVMAIVEAEAALIHPDRQAQPAPQRRRWWQLSQQPRLAFAALAVVFVLGAGALIGQAVTGDDRTVIAAEVGDARLIDPGDGHHATLEVEQLPPPGPARVYQVWIQHEGKAPAPTNALFSTRSDGTASVDVPGSLEGVEAVMVTQEPEGGSEAPTTEPVIIARPA